MSAKFPRGGANPFSAIRLDRLGDVLPLGKIVALPNYISLFYFFQKTRIKDYFKFQILDFDLRLKRPTIIQNLIKFLFLNGISIVVISSWLTQYAICFNKLLNA